MYEQAMNKTVAIKTVNSQSIVGKLVDIDKEALKLEHYTYYMNTICNTDIFYVAIDHIVSMQILKER